jgi:hypothetical protein
MPGGSAPPRVYRVLPSDRRAERLFRAGPPVPQIPGIFSHSRSTGIVNRFDSTFEQSQNVSKLSESEWLLEVGNLAIESPGLRESGIRVA